MTRAIIWDFDGTLAFRNGLWSGCLLETLDEYEHGHTVQRDQIVPHLRQGFPWHQPEVEHPELCDPAAWWRRVEAILAAAYEAVGYGKDRATKLARLAHQRYVDLSGWQLFPDTLPVLEQLQRAGWRHLILSNHVPELPSIVQGLGLSGVIAAIISSAVTGYEKPHPHAFAIALEAVGGTERVWMVGDNVDADVRGAEAVGIPAILVRTDAGDVTRRAPDLWGVIPIVERDLMSRSAPDAPDRPPQSRHRAEPEHTPPRTPGGGPPSR